MTRKQFKALLEALKKDEKPYQLERDEHGKLKYLFEQRDLNRLHQLGYLDEPKNFLDVEAYIRMLEEKVEQERIEIYGE